MRLLEKEDSDGKTDEHAESAEEIRKEIGKAVKKAPGRKYRGEVGGWLRECASNDGPNDGSERASGNGISQPVALDFLDLPNTPNQGHDRVGTICKSVSNLARNLVIGLGLFFKNIR